MSENERHKQDQSRWSVPVNLDKGSFEQDRPPSGLSEITEQKSQSILEV